MGKKQIDSDGVNNLNSVFDDTEDLDSGVDVIDALMGQAEEVRNAPKKKIRIHNQEGPDGDKSVFVAVNGMAYSLPREQVISVPLPIIDVLRNAVELKYYRDESEGKSFGPILTRTINRIPFSEIGGL